MFDLLVVSFVIRTGQGLADIQRAGYPDLLVKLYDVLCCGQMSVESWEILCSLELHF